MIHRFFCRLGVYLVDSTSWDGVLVLFEAVVANHWNFVPLETLGDGFDYCDLLGGLSPGR